MSATKPFEQEVDEFLTERGIPFEKNVSVDDLKAGTTVTETIRRRAEDTLARHGKELADLGARTWVGGIDDDPDARESLGLEHQTDVRVRLSVPDDQEFVDEDQKFIASPDMRELAQELISEYPELYSLTRRRIDYAWKQTGGKEKGRQRLGACAKVSGVQKLYTQADWIIWIAADNCRQLTPRQLEAVLYHELCHPMVDENDQPALVGHDAEMFFGEIRRYGLWRMDLEAASDVFTQIKMEGIA